MYRGIKPGSDASFRALVASASFRAGVRSAYPLSSGQVERVQTRMREIRTAVAFEVLHRIRRRRPLPWSELARFLRADPAGIVFLPWEMLRHVGHRLKSRGART